MAAPVSSTNKVQPSILTSVLGENSQPQENQLTQVMNERVTGTAGTVKRHPPTRKPLKVRQIEKTKKAPEAEKSTVTAPKAEKPTPPSVADKAVPAMKNTGFLRGLAATVGKMATFGSTKDIGSKPAAAQPRAEAKPKAPTSAVTPAAQAPTAEPASSPAAPTPAEPKAPASIPVQTPQGQAPSAEPASGTAAPAPVEPKAPAPFSKPDPMFPKDQKPEGAEGIAGATGPKEPPKDDPATKTDKTAEKVDKTVQNKGIFARLSACFESILKGLTTLFNYLRRICLPNRQNVDRT